MSGLSLPKVVEEPTERSLLLSICESQRRVERGLAELGFAQERLEEYVRKQAGDGKPNYILSVQKSDEVDTEHLRRPPKAGRGSVHLSPALGPLVPASHGTNTLSPTAAMMAAPSFIQLHHSFSGHAEHSETHDGNRRSAPGALPLNWPAMLVPRFDVAQCSGRAPVSAPDGMTVQNSTSESPDDHEEGSRTRVTWGSLLRDPGSNPHVVLAVVGLLVLLHDLTVIPFALAWQLAFVGYLQVSTMISVSFWTCDIGVNFLKGYYNGGDLVTNPKLIAKRYARTWLIPDVMMVSCDWTGILMEIAWGQGGNSATGLKMLRFARMGRLLRIAGLCRMLRVFQSLQDVLDDILSDDIRFALSTLWLAGGALWSTHLIACGWFAVGRFGYSDTGLKWVTTFNDKMNKESDMKLDDMDDTPGHIYQYLSSYHWSLAQVSLGSMEVDCSNSGERMYNVICLIVGLFGGSALISLLSANMLAFQSRQRDKTEKLRTLRKYLQENAVPPRLAVRVLRQVTERMSAKKLLTEDAVLALDMLSTGLRGELHASICKPTLTSHQLIALFNSIDLVWTNRVTQTCIEMVYLTKADSLFFPGMAATGTYKVIQGRALYLQTPDTSLVAEAVEVQVDSSDWLSEGALWCDWLHVGTTECPDASCKVLGVRTVEFGTLARNHPQIKVIACEYGRQFMKRVIAAKPPHADWPSDVCVPFTDFPEMVCSMNHQVARSIGLHCLQQHPGRKKQSADNLMKEVLKGSSTVIMDGTRKLLRIVSVVVLQLERLDGCIFVKLGKASSHQVQTECELLGLKRQRDELAEDALQRLMSEKATFLSGCLEFTGMSVTTVEKMSREYNIHTRYLRTVCSAKLTQQFQATMVKVRGDTWRASKKDGPPPPAFAVPTNMLDWMVGHPVYWIPTDEEGTGTFCSWLSTEQYESLQSSYYQQALQTWLTTVVTQLSSATPVSPHVTSCGTDDVGIKDQQPMLQDTEETSLASGEDDGPNRIVSNASSRMVNPRGSPRLSVRLTNRVKSAVGRVVVEAHNATRRGGLQPDHSFDESEEVATPQSKRTPDLVGLESELDAVPEVFHLEGNSNRFENGNEDNDEEDEQRVGEAYSV